VSTLTVENVTITSQLTGNLIILIIEIVVNILEIVKGPIYN